jgi:hypothetical protein
MIRFWDLVRLYGAEEEEEEEEEEETPPTPDPERTLTAKELDAIIGRATDRASRKAGKELAKELGFENLGELKTWAASQRKAESDAMDEKDRALKEAEEEKKQAAALRSSLASDRLDLAIERAVVAEGVIDQKKLDRISAMVRIDLDPDLVNDENDWEEAIAEALSSVKEDTPELFAQKAGSAGHGSGDGGARGDSKKDEDKEAERQKAIEDEYAKRGLISYPG